MPPRKSSNKQLRLRVFAGPNGSGKSTIIKAVKNTKVKGKPIDFGYYINADEITQALIDRGFLFSSFNIKLDATKFKEFANGSTSKEENEISIAI